ncbi:MAG: hypothetical protein HYR75_07525, partial [Gemmatimonadetes bacterium]|nr:hypothetical protein [Gemmatimonadota bacterium]
TKLIRLSAIGTCGALVAATAGAQQPTVRERPLGPIVHASKELLGAVSAVRGLPNGTLLVNDITGRKVVLFDSTLSTYSVVADTTSATANAYSSRAGGLIPWKGDTTLFVDPNSLSMLVLDGAGKVARVMSVPRANEAPFLIGGPNGTPGTDPQGRLLFRGMPNMMRMMGALSGGGAPSMPDSAPLLRIDLATRKLDTVAALKIPKQNVSINRSDDGRVSVNVTVNPMQVVDDWAILRDGSVAVLRGQDYHIDWVRPDGSHASTAKIPFDWKRMSDEDKIAFIDSSRVAMEKLRAAALSGNLNAAAAGAGAVMGGGQQVRIEMRGDGPMPPPRGGGAGDRSGGPGGVGNVNVPPITMVSPSELPDYAPPFAAGSARGDLDGDLWVRTSKVVNGGSVYDVIDGKGQLVDRVLVPAGRVIAGFGPGVVYMGVRDGAGVRLEIARVK